MLLTCVLAFSGLMTSRAATAATISMGRSSSRGGVVEQEAAGAGAQGAVACGVNPLSERRRAGRPRQENAEPRAHDRRHRHPEAAPQADMTTFDRSFWEGRWSRVLREHADRVADRPP